MNARQVIAGLGWSSLATLVNGVAQFAFLAALARLLDPATFGLMAMASIVLRFTSSFAQLGFAQALIQKPELRHEDTTAALLMAFGLGLALYGVTLLAAPWCAGYFQAPELAALLTVYALSLPLGTLSGLPIALLRRQGRFKRISVIEVLSFLIGYGAVGVACASAGLGVWSLIAATLAQQAMTLVLGFATAGYRLAWPLRRESFRALWGFGATYSVVGFLEFLSANVESLYLGRAFGKAELGVFNRAATLTNLPVEQAVSAVNKVLFPALAAMQHDRSRVADGFEMLLLCIGLLSTALACGIAAAAPDAVALLLGAKWFAAAPIVAIIAFATPPMFMYVACGVTLDSLGALAPKLRLQLVTLIFKVALVVALARWGLRGIACAVVAAEVLRLAMGVHAVSRELSLPPARCARLMGLFIFEGGAVFVAVHGVAGMAAAGGVPLAGRIALEALAGVAVVGAGLVMLLSRFPGYAPLQRFETVRQWHGRVLKSLQLRASHS